MKKLILFMLILLILLGIVLYYISKTKNKVGSSKGSYINYPLKNAEKTKKLKIVSWNTAWFYGSGSEGGSDYIYKNKSFFEGQLEKSLKLLQDLDADIIALQEVDFDSSKSHFINQVEFLARKLEMNYALAPSWDHAYVPFPYFPIRNHFGRVSSGGAILSKYPIVKNEVTLFEKPSSNPWWYNLLYLFRYNQKVTLSINDRDFTLSNLHLEAFDMESRQKQIKELIKINHNADFICGDFNMIPTYSEKTKDFEGYDDDYTGDTSFDLMINSGFKTTFNDADFKNSPQVYYTFPSSQPDRRLDYFFVKKEYDILSSRVIDSKVSDHRPISVVISLE
jgi:endonuclease/exonuclease/phosphatase family metal-dependent hydrolase